MSVFLRVTFTCQGPRIHNIQRSTQLNQTAREGDIKWFTQYPSQHQKISYYAWLFHDLECHQNKHHVCTHVVVGHGVPDRAALCGDELVAALVDDADAHLALVTLLSEAPARNRRNTGSSHCICDFILFSEIRDLG